MKYETPELIALMPAIIAVQSPKPIPNSPLDTAHNEVGVGAYADWED